MNLTMWEEIKTVLDPRECLVRLCEVPGPSADEDAVAAFVKARAADLTDACETDALGNLTLLRRGSDEQGARIMLAAHMDEISLLVQRIDDRGFVQMSAAGGFDPRTLLGQEVVVHGREQVRGVIGAKPPHLTSPAERKKAVPLKDLFVDFGMPAPRVRELVRVGDRVTLHRETRALIGERISGKAMDDRASVVAMLLCLEELARLQVGAHTHAVATVQEEIGCKGARVAAHGLNPDLAIAIDVCHGDSPGVPDDLTFKLGEGPVLTCGPHIHPKLFERLQAVAQRENIPVQVEYEPGATSTDADPIAIAKEGIPTALVSIPLRYMHTSVETVDL
ncbi:MAG: M20/M25/M40 family metallo-hydrolase, partial [Firmicutes bacterium]|nr:M20/M25/M40 family metallo-hydrolase [Bacillota bacterium]